MDELEPLFRAKPKHGVEIWNKRISESLDVLDKILEEQEPDSGLTATLPSYRAQQKISEMMRFDMLEPIMHAALGYRMDVPLFTALQDRHELSPYNNRTAFGAKIQFRMEDFLEQENKERFYYAYDRTMRKREQSVILLLENKQPPMSMDYPLACLIDNKISTLFKKNADFLYTFSGFESLNKSSLGFLLTPEAIKQKGAGDFVFIGQSHLEDKNYAVTPIAHIDAHPLSRNESITFHFNENKNETFPFGQEIKSKKLLPYEQDFANEAVKYFMLSKKDRRAYAYNLQTP